MVIQRIAGSDPAANDIGFATTDAGLLPRAAE
jgi:hypothetical protein